MASPQFKLFGKSVAISVNRTLEKQAVKVRNFLLVCLFLLPSYAQAPIDPERIYSGFYAAIDESVGCPNIPPVGEDALLTGLNGEMTLTANPLRKNGLFTNVIAARHMPFEEKRYTISGYWRNDEFSQAEVISLNLQLVEDYTESFAEITWGLNPFSENYGWIYTRVELDKPERLFKITPDYKWHRFQLVTDYRDGKRILYSITVDQTTVILDREMGQTPKEWKSSFSLLLETSNRYTACVPLFGFTATSHWRDGSVLVER